MLYNFFRDCFCSSRSVIFDRFHLQYCNFPIHSSPVSSQAVKLSILNPKVVGSTHASDLFNPFIQRAVLVRAKSMQIRYKLMRLLHHFDLFYDRV